MAFQAFLNTINKNIEHFYSAGRGIPFTGVNFIWKYKKNKKFKKCHPITDG